MATLASVFSKGTRLGKNIWCRTKVKRLIIYVTAMVCFVVYLHRTKGYEIHITSSVADKLLYTVRVKVRTPILQTPYYRIDLPLRFCQVFIFLQ